MLRGSVCLSHTLMHNQLELQKEALRPYGIYGPLAERNRE